MDGMVQLNAPARARGPGDLDAGALPRISAQQPLEAYRREELARSHACFFGPDPGYHEARRRFVHKLGAPCARNVPAQAA